MPMRSLYHQSKVATVPPTAKEAAAAAKKVKAAAKPVVEKKVKTKKENK